MFYNISCISTHQFSGQKLPPLNLACADLNVTSKITVGNVTDDDGEDVTNGEVPAVGEGVKKNEFDVNLTDDGDGEDVTNGEGVNENVLGDGEADIGDEDGDNNEGVFFFRLLFTFQLIIYISILF